MTMRGTSRLLIAAAMIAALSPAAMAAPKTGWDGTWGGKATETTSVTVAANKVVSYTYQGASTPVATSTVTLKSLTYGDDCTVVTLTKTGRKTTFAALHTMQGDATAQLTRE